MKQSEGDTASKSTSTFNVSIDRPIAARSKSLDSAMPILQSNSSSPSSSDTMTHSGRIIDCTPQQDVQTKSSPGSSFMSWFTNPTRSTSSSSSAAAYSSPRSLSSPSSARKTPSSSSSSSSTPTEQITQKRSASFVPSSRPSLLSSPMYQTNKPVSLEGVLRCRKSRTAPGDTGWRYSYVVLDITGTGSLTCLNHKPKMSSGKSSTGASSDTGLSWGSTLERRHAKESKRGNTNIQSAAKSLRHIHELSSSSQGKTDISERFYLPEHVNWVAKDVENTSTEFVIEIPTDMPVLPFMSSNEDEEGIPSALVEDFERAKVRGKPFRVYFACAHKSNEKTLWLQAFSQLDRLSHEIHSRRGLQSIFDKKVRVTHRRVRTVESHAMATASKALGLNGARIDTSESSEVERPSHPLPGVVRGDYDRKEFLVYPTYAYPNRWMTEKELYTEMIKPSVTFHDLRRSVLSQKNASKKEIGTLKVEVLQCIGLPSLDFASETDAVTYLVCGSYAFATDVIWDRLNPMWLPKTRRACIFPVFHAYASLYAGVFDDDGKGEKDDFAGRVVIDLSQLRPRSTYDVTLPLRTSSHVYSRQPRGSIRLRFSLEWSSDRDAILSYIPQKVAPPTSARPEDDVTVLCADEKAFRNVATVVHGDHMPGRFSAQELKATMREANFTRKVMMMSIKENMFGIVSWKNPVLSGIVFCAWMHCIYVGSFSLVPFYLSFFAFLMMARSYTFYGSRSPIQNGFVPPSWEELCMALLRKDSHVIEPLKVKSRNSGEETVPFTYNEKTAWLMTKGLGFNSELPNGEEADYHMEFPYSQGLRDPITGKVRYPRFSVKESLVVKSKQKRKVDDDDDEDSLGHPKDSKSAGTLSLLVRRKAEAPKESTAKTYEENSLDDDSERSIESSTVELKKRSDFSSPYKSFDELPLPLRMPEQDVDAPGPAKKKKLVQELQDLKGNLHKLTFHQFHDITHVKAKHDSVYFGSAGKKGAKRGAQLDTEMDKLLNVGQFSAGNPVVARVGLYLEPILSAVQSGIAVTRVIYNVLTWRDPILSFWVSSLFLASSVVLYFFPWRPFLFVAGVAIVGPQNYILRVLDDNRLAPKPLQKIFDKMRVPKKYSKKDVKSVSAAETLPTDQPILSCHTTDNSPPPELDPTTVDPREIHQVCVPYSQLRSRRFYDWPPEPRYAKCTPTTVSSADSNLRGRSAFASSKGNNSLSKSEHDRYRSMRHRVRIH